MSAFNSGFRMGADIYTQGQRLALMQEENERAKRESDARLQQLGLQTDAMRRAASRENQLSDLSSQIGDYTTGFNRSGFNDAANADFDAALAASDNMVRSENATRQGLTVPATPMPVTAGGVPASNMDRERGLRQQFTRQVDPNSSEYQSGLAGLRQRYALAAGDMKDFDTIGTAERNRRQAADDSAFALDVVRNPDGDAARGARSYINQQTRGFTIDPPNKDGISTLRIIQGDRTKPVDISPSDLSKIAVGVRRLERGDVGGLDVISAVNKDVAAAVKAEMGQLLDVTKTNNDAAFRTASLNNDAARTRNQAEYYAFQRDRFNRQDNLNDAQEAHQRRVDGVMEGYQAATNLAQNETNPERKKQLLGAAAIYAREYDQLRATAPRGLRLPSIRSLDGAQRDGSGVKPQSVDEEGTKKKIDGRLVISDGLGGYIPADTRGNPVGVMPSERDGFLARSGLPANLISDLPWNATGTSVGYRGRAYNVRDPKDIAQLKSDYEMYSRNDQEVEEYSRLPHGIKPNPYAFGPKITYRPDPNAPSIYAGPEEWARYRASQAR